MDIWSLLQVCLDTCLWLARLTHWQQSLAWDCSAAYSWYERIYQLFLGRQAGPAQTCEWSDHDRRAVTAAPRPQSAARRTQRQGNAARLPARPLQLPPKAPGTLPRPSRPRAQRLLSARRSLSSEQPEGEFLQLRIGC